MPSVLTENKRIAFDARSCTVHRDMLTTEVTTIKQKIVVHANATILATETSKLNISFNILLSLIVIKELYLVTSLS